MTCCLQDFLELDISDDFTTKWSSQQWKRWEQCLRGLKLPADGLIVQRESKRLKVHASRFSLPSWSLSTQALLAVGARWCSTLSLKTRPRIRSWLTAFIMQSFPWFSFGGPRTLTLTAFMPCLPALVTMQLRLSCETVRSTMLLWRRSLGLRRHQG